MKTKVVHCRKSPYDIYIGRPSKWGNPFMMGGAGGTREEVVQKFREYIMDSPLRNDLHELRGKVLACWCAPLLCHGDILAELADLGDLDASFSPIHGNAIDS